jgi:hypothetical protein
MNEELEKLLAAATPGPWEVSERIKDWRPQVVSTEHGPICTMHIPEIGDADPNAALIVAAVNALPGLLAKLERYERALQAIVDNAEIGEREADTAFARAALSETGAA